MRGDFHVSFVVNQEEEVARLLSAALLLLGSVLLLLVAEFGGEAVTGRAQSWGVSVC